MAASHEPRLRIRVPSSEIGLSLSRVMNAFRGERGLTYGGGPTGEVSVVHYEAPRNAAELSRMLEAVSLWLPEVGMDAIAVEADGEVYTIEAGQPIVLSAGTTPVAMTSSRDQSVRLYWKLEDSPEGSADEDPNDVGPAWIDYPDGTSESVNEGEWMTRAEAKRLAAESGFTLDLDG